MKELQKSGKRGRFERLMLPHLKAAYRMARALMENESDVEDAVQEAYLRASGPSMDSRVKMAVPGF